MVKMRVYELARELKLESKALIAKLKAIGVEVASHQSTLTAAQVEKVKAAETAGSDPKVVVRRRPKPEEKKVDPVLEAAAETVVAPSEEALAPSVTRIRRAAKPAESSGESASVEALAVEAAPVAPAEIKAISVSPASEAGEGEAVAIALAQATTPEQLAQIAAQDAKVIAEAKAKLLSRSLRRPEPTPSSRPQQSQQSTSHHATSSEPRPERAERRQLFTPGSGATIVRKATTKEVEELRHQQQVQSQPKIAPRPMSSRPPLREDSRGGPDNRYRSVSSGGSQGSTGGYQGSQGSSGGFRSSQPPHAAPPPMPFPPGEDEFGERTNKKAFPIKGKTDRPGIVPEVEPKVVKPAPKRKSLSTRELLESLDTEVEVEVVEDVLEAPRRKKVYTPSGGKRRDNKRSRRDFKATAMTTPRAAYRVVKVTGNAISISDLAHQMSVKASELIKKLMGQGIMATLNQAIDFDTAALLSSEFGFECKDATRNVSDVLEHLGAKRGEMRTRPPIVTVMGHVDHGKTSILDRIRKSKVAEQEAGGITQHIGAYCVVHNGSPITFIDTPGHEAFSAMRARGAKLTDIVILVVAADDGVMPQTIEAISHARSADVPIIVAINKIDKQNINLDRIMNELSEHGIQSEEWGGQNQLIKVSALKGTGIDELLEAVLLQTEILELQAEYTGPATATVVEANLDKNRGPVATVIVTSGTLSPGDMLVAGTSTGRVRAMYDHNRKPVLQATPSVPVEIVGLTDVPEAGDVAHVVEDEKVLREVLQIRENQQAVTGGSVAATSLEELLGKVRNDEAPRLNLILKADTQGSLEAISDAITKLKSEKVSVVIVHKAVGGINQSDLSLAETSGSILFGFNVRAISALASRVQAAGSIIKYYSVIYDLIDAVKSLMVGKLPPVCVETITGHAQVREAINVPKIGLIAGSSVMDGKISRSSLLRLVRNEIVIYTGKVGSLRRFKEDVKEVARGYECGISIDGYNDVKVGDVIEAFQMDEQAAVLDI